MYQFLFRSIPDSLVLKLDVYKRQWWSSLVYSNPLSSVGKLFLPRKFIIYFAVSSEVLALRLEYSVYSSHVLQNSVKLWIDSVCHSHSVIHIPTTNNAWNCSSPSRYEARYFTSVTIRKYRELAVQVYYFFSSRQGMFWSKFKRHYFEFFLSIYNAVRIIS